MPHEQYESCLQACYSCATACDHCAVSCLSEPDVADMEQCIRTDLDCADMCRFAAAVMGRGSELSKRVCELCAGICDQCAQVCAQHDHEHCRACARACHACAEECRRMAA